MMRSRISLAKKKYKWDFCDFVISLFFECLLFFPFFRPSTMETRPEIPCGAHEEARDELLLQLLKPHPFWSFQASSAALQAPLLAEQLPLGLALAQPKRTAQALRWRLELAL